MAQREESCGSLKNPCGLSENFGLLAYSPLGAMTKHVGKQCGKDRYLTGRDGPPQIGASHPIGCDFSEENAKQNLSPSQNDKNHPVSGMEPMVDFSEQPIFSAKTRENGGEGEISVQNFSPRMSDILDPRVDEKFGVTSAVPRDLSSRSTPPSMGSQFGSTAGEGIPPMSQQVLARHDLGNSPNRVPISSSSPDFSAHCQEVAVFNSARGAAFGGRGPLRSSPPPVASSDFIGENSEQRFSPIIPCQRIFPGTPEFGEVFEPAVLYHGSPESGHVASPRDGVHGLMNSLSETPFFSTEQQPFFSQNPRKDFCPVLQGEGPPGNALGCKKST